MNLKIQRLDRAATALLVVDIQERLLPQIFEKERLVRESARIIQGAAILKIPIFITEQYKKGLGLTVAEISSLIKEFAPIEKETFSACGAEGLVEKFKSRNIRDILLCGMESHICILNTCLDLLAENFNVFVIADAISARNPDNTRLALERMRDSGAVVASTEMALFELLERAATDEFKEILKLVR
jgi:nicotinamidase-related amidase